MTPGGRFLKGPGELAECDPLGHFFAGPTDEDRARVRAGLLGRSALVRANGWEPYMGLWSTGEVIGVAVLLGEQGELTALGETVLSALERWAFDLWGLNGGQADVDNACEATRQWFLDAANEFESGYVQLALEFNCETSRAERKAARAGYIRRTEAHRGIDAERGEDAE